MEQKLKILTKSTTIVGITITFILHIYTAVILASTNAMNDNIMVTFSFDLLFFGGCILFWIFAGKGQHGKFFEWVSFMVPTVFNIWSWTWLNEQYDFLEGMLSYFPLNSALIIINMVLFLISAVYLIIIPIIALIIARFYGYIRDGSMFQSARGLGSCRRR